MTRPKLSIETVAETLVWPEAEGVLDPSGAGPAVLAELAREKIARGLSKLVSPGALRAGVLTANPDSESTEPLLAIVVEFSYPVGNKVIAEAHRLAWNFSHSPSLVTIEPDLVRVWTCCEAPRVDQPIDDRLVHEIGAEALTSSDVASETAAARALHWFNLISGKFFDEHSARFDRDGRADQLLLGNLRHIRGLLIADGLIDDDVCHDLLARVIFVQFLFDRRDPDGKAALNKETLKRLFLEGLLSKPYETFSAILADYDDSYRLFAWLNSKFNGDLFPGKGETAEEREASWAREREVVLPRHLAVLAEFIRGDLDMPSGQGYLWPIYSFDVIPLEFISSIYETFVTERAARDGIFYTPGHLVDFVLDQVLPWRGTSWNLRILDPACGSGIFLVKAFQRLVHRWKQANPGTTIKADVLRRLLTENILGVDKDPHAVRVACFSLYLAMCDEIEPRHYWTQIRFPNMRDQRLICSDFFAGGKGFDDDDDTKQLFDLVVGNAPWGDGLATDSSNTWATNHSWEVANNDIGGLFLAKGARLLQASGRVAMIQSANALLFNASGPAKKFRQQLFTRHRIEAVFNLSALRFKVFKRKTHTTKTSIAPACVVILRPDKPEPSDYLIYASPKALDVQVDDFAIAIEPHHVHRMSVVEAVSNPVIWTTLMWGTPRDVQLLRKFERFDRLGQLKGSNGIRTRQGIVFGDKKRPVPELNGRPLFLEKKFPDGDLRWLNVSTLPLISDLAVHSKDSSDYAAFGSPQILIKQGYQVAHGRFQARMVDDGGVICSKSYVSATGPRDVIEAAWLSYNSLVATYVMQLRSGRMAAYRPEANVHEVLDVPLPPRADFDLATLLDYTAIDRAAFDAFKLKDAERALIEDMAFVTIPDFRGDVSAPGSVKTGDPSGDEVVLRLYCRTFSEVLKSGFGKTKRVGATIYKTSSTETTAHRLVSIHLLDDSSDEEEVVVKNVEHTELFYELRRLGSINASGRARPIGQRLGRFYDASSGVPTIFLLKPDALRYWTRTMALNDADQVAADLFQWINATRPVSKQ